MTQNYYRKVKQILWVIFGANILVAILKIILGNIIKSASMTADGFHSLTDGSSNIVGLIGLRYASMPIDKDHPYGHSKFETLAGLFISGMLFVISGKIILDALKRFVTPVKPDVTVESIIVLILTLCINIFISIFEYRKGKKYNSMILISDSMHTRSDIYISIGVLFTLVCIKLGVPAVIDPIASLVVSIFILHAAYEIFKENSGVLVDKAAVDNRIIADLVLSFEEVKDLHQVRSRGSKNSLHIDMHIMTEPDLSVEESHRLIHDIEKKLQEEININTQVIAHIEPYEPK